MKNDVYIKNGITIPSDELEITTSRASGPGGQHVNKTDTRVTVRWNVKNTTSLDEVQKERVLQAFKTRLTAHGDFIVHSSESGSQYKNRELALERMAKEVRHALHVPKKRMATKVSASSKEARLASKTRRATVKKMRSKKIELD